MQVIEMLYGKLENQEALAIGGYLNHPLSRGELLLRSNKSSDRPLFDPHYLENPSDVKVLAEGDAPSAIYAGRH
jgi:choline dehydrogenase